MIGRKESKGERKWNPPSWYSPCVGVSAFYEVSKILCADERQNWLQHTQARQQIQRAGIQPSRCQSPSHRIPATSINRAVILSGVLCGLASGFPAHIKGLVLFIFILKLLWFSRSLSRYVYLSEGLCQRDWPTILCLLAVSTLCFYDPFLPFLHFLYLFFLHSCFTFWFFPLSK